jgi:flagellar hook-length control protein FliK
MSSARISAHKGGVEVLPKASTTPRAGDAADPATGFAAALGAMAANLHPPSGHHSHGSADAPAGEDPTAGGATAHSPTAHGPTAGGPTADGPMAGGPMARGLTADGPTDGGATVAPEHKSAKSADPAGDADNMTSTTTLPGFAGWFTAGNQAADGTPPTAGQRPPAKPAAAASEAAAAAVAASLVGAATQPVAARAGAPDTPAQPAVIAPAVIAADGLAKSPDDHAHGASTGSPATVDTGAAEAPHAFHGDPTAPGIPADIGQQSSGPAASDPLSPVVAANVSAAPLTPALPAPAPAPARTGQADVAALASAMPAALVNPVAPSAAGSGPHDFADTARDGQAAAAVAFSGVDAAGAGTGSAGGLGAPPVDAAASSAPGFGADAGASSVATQLSGQVLRLLTNSGHEAMVRLHPPDLGEVTLRVAVSGRDVSAWFGSSQPAVQQTISHGLGQLQADLGNAGYNLSNAWVGADASGFGSRGGSAPPPPSALAARLSAPPVAPVAATPSSNPGVSIYV